MFLSFFESFVPAKILILPEYPVKSFSPPPFPLIVGSGDAGLVHVHGIRILVATEPLVGIASNHEASVLIWPVLGEIINDRATCLAFPPHDIEHKND